MVVSFGANFREWGFFKNGRMHQNPTIDRIVDYLELHHRLYIADTLLHNSDEYLRFLKYEQEFRGQDLKAYLISEITRLENQIKELTASIKTTTVSV